MGYLYIHYGDLYKVLIRHRCESPQNQSISQRRKNQTLLKNLRDQDIVYVLTSETIDDLGHAYLFNNPRNLLQCWD